jgi:type IV secretion system protein VirD4
VILATTAPPGPGTRAAASVARRVRRFISGIEEIMPMLTSLARRIARDAGIGVLAAVATAGAWLVSASALWSKGTGTPFGVFAWSDATKWWGANWWVNLWLCLAAVVPTIFLTMILFGLLLAPRWRWRGGRRLTQPSGGDVRAVERGVTDNHGHARWRSMADAMKLFPGPHPAHGGVVVGEAYRVDQDTVARIRFMPRDRRT